MFTIDFDLSGLRKAAREGQTFRILSSHRVVEVAAHEGLQASKVRRRYKNRTGNLTAKAYARGVQANLTGGLAEMVWPVRYARFVDEGTAPHEIRPRRGAFLRFQIGGQAIFARAVKHPGTKAYNFSGDAKEAAHAALVREVEESFFDLEKILNR